MTTYWLKLESIIKQAAIALIKGYHRFISPFFGHHCRFVPTCSEYAMEAIRTKGLFSGLLKTVKRLLKCHPLGASGYDPCPCATMSQNLIFNESARTVMTSYENTNCNLIESHGCPTDGRRAVKV